MKIKLTLCIAGLLASLCTQAQTLIAFKQNDLFGFKDASGKVIVQPRYTGVDDISDGWKGAEIPLNGNAPISVNKGGTYRTVIGVPMLEGGKWGFMDRTGKEITALKYDRVRQFAEGLAIVTFNALDGAINLAGKEVIAPKFKSLRDFSEGMAPFNENLKTGYINTAGKIVIQPLYADVKRFSEGLAAVQPYGGKYGFIDKTGKVVIPMAYDQQLDLWLSGYESNTFRHGQARVETDHKEFFIDKQGNKAEPNIYWQVYAILYDAVTGLKKSTSDKLAGEDPKTKIKVYQAVRNLSGNADFVQEYPNGTARVYLANYVYSIPASATKAKQDLPVITQLIDELAEEVYTKDVQTDAAGIKNTTLTARNGRKVLLLREAKDVASLVIPSYLK